MATPSEVHVLDQVRREVAGVLGQTLSPSAVQVDVDIFGSPEGLVDGRDLDSLDIIEITAAIEDRFGLSFANDASLPEDLTLRSLAAHIVASLSAAAATDRG